MTNTQGSDTESIRGELAKWLARHDNKYAWSKMTRGEKNEQVDFTKYTSGYKELISLFDTYLDQQIAEAEKNILQQVNEGVIGKGLFIDGAETPSQLLNRLRKKQRKALAQLIRQDEEK